MDNTDPLQDPQQDMHESEGVEAPPLEIHSPNIPPIEYLDKRDARVIAILTFFSTLGGKALVGVVAALIVGGTVWHFAHHHKTSTHSAVHAKAPRATAKHTAAAPKKAVAKASSHKHTKKSSKKKTTHSDSSSPKRQPRPWFSSRESNG
jgi:hypothetical protein